MTERGMGYLWCGSHKLEIIRIEFAKGVLVVWGFARGPLYAYSGPVEIFGWDGIPFWGTVGNEDNFSSWIRVHNGQDLFLPVILGETTESIQAVIAEGRKELESRYSEPMRLKES